MERDEDRWRVVLELLVLRYCVHHSKIYEEKVNSVVIVATSNTSKEGCTVFAVHCGPGMNKNYENFSKVCNPRGSPHPPRARHSAVGGATSPKPVFIPEAAFSETGNMHGRLWLISYHAARFVVSILLLYWSERDQLELMCSGLWDTLGQRLRVKEIEPVMIG